MIDPVTVGLRATVSEDFFLGVLLRSAVGGWKTPLKKYKFVSWDD